MRWLLGLLEKRLRQGRGRRPARPAARPAPSLEGLEDRRLLSATTMLPSLAAPGAASPGDTTNSAQAAVVSPPTTPASSDSATIQAWQTSPIGSFGGDTSSAAVHISTISDPKLADQNWHFVGTYQFPVPFGSAPPPAATDWNAAPSEGQPPTSGATAPATPAEPTPSQTTTTAPTPPASTGSQEWSSDTYYHLKSDSIDLILRLHASLSAAAMKSPAQDAGAASDSSATPVATANSAQTGDAVNTPAATTPAAAPTPANILTVEVSVAASPTQPQTASAPSSQSASVPTTALLSFVVAPAADGQGIQVALTATDETAGAAVAGGPSTPDSSPASDQAAPTFVFSLQLLITLGQDSATGPVAAPAAPSAAPAPEGAGGSVERVLPAPAASSASAAPADPAAPDAGGSATTAAVAAPSATPAVEVLAIDASTLTAAAAKFAAATVAAGQAADWTTAAPTGPVVATPQVGAERWAALSGSLSDGLVAATVGPLAFFAPGAAWAPQWNGASAPSSHFAGGLSGRAGIGDYLCAAGGVMLSGLRLSNGLGSDPAAQDALPIAEVVKESSESLTSLVRGLYRALLGRPADGGEEQGWVAALLGGQSEEQFLEAFLATAEFGRRADTLVTSGTTDERYLGALHLALLQRPATADELSAWLAALPELGREGVVACLVRSNEFRALSVQGFYLEVYGQAADPADAAQWAASPLHLLAVRDALASRPDLFAPAAEATSEPRP